jgi:glycosyltransferase involved in cell wall biosynthesis
MRSALERRAVECGVADIVEFLGFVPDERLAGIYQSSDVFVLPSITSEQSTEGFGIVFLEAGLFGLPVVACRSGGVDDAVADFETGLLVSPGDAAELGGAVARLLDDRELRLRLGRQGRERVLRDFSWGTRRRGLIEVLDGM